MKRFDPHALTPEELLAAHRAYNALGELVARAVTGYAKLPPVFPRKETPCQK
jgi:hypothetical protein